MNLDYKIIILGVVLLCIGQNLLGGCYTTDLSKRWPSSRIPFKFDANWPADKILEKETVYQAAAYLSSATNLCFQEANQYDASYMLIKYEYSGGCAASGGGYISPAEIAAGNQYPTIRCKSSNLITICHEMMHLLGIHHEHQRPDRDLHIAVNEDCIRTSWKIQYLKLQEGYFGYSPIYDYHSIMHYRDDAGLLFDLNCQKVMQAISAPNIVMGQRSFLSPIDVQTINFMYPDVCDRCNYVPNYTHNSAGQYNEIDDGWGDPLVPFTYNIENAIDVSATFEGSLFMTSDESISLMPEFFIDGLDTENNRSTLCLEIEDCTIDSISTRNSASKKISEGFSTGFKIYPNPVNTKTNLFMDLMKEGAARIELLDLNGRLIKVIGMDVLLSKGQNNLSIDLGGINTGIYLCRVVGDSWSEVQKIYKN